MSSDIGAVFFRIQVFESGGKYAVNFQRSSLAGPINPPAQTAFIYEFGQVYRLSFQFDGTNCIISDASGTVLASGIGTTNTAMAISSISYQIAAVPGCSWTLGIAMFDGIPPNQTSSIGIAAWLKQLCSFMTLLK